jgi:hypothetical protein
MAFSRQHHRNTPTKHSVVTAVHTQATSQQQLSKTGGERGDRKREGEKKSDLRSQTRAEAACPSE